MAQTKRYCQPGLATGGNDGTTAADAWQSYSDLATGVAAGDDVYVYGDETTTVTLSTSGTETAPIRIVGADSSFDIVEGTYSTLNGTGGANVVTISGTYNYLEKIKTINGTGIGLYMTNIFNTLYDCHATSSGSTGIRLQTKCIAVRCTSTNATGEGIRIITNSYIADCVASGVALGFRFFNGEAAGSNLIAYDCTSGVQYNGNVGLFGFIADDCTKDVQEFVGSTNALLTRGILSNGTTGLDLTYGQVHALNTAFYNNTADFISATKYWVLGMANTSNQAQIALGADPYDDQASRDYTLTWTNSDLVQLPVVLDANNTSYETTGLEPLAASSGGGRQPRLRIHGA